MMYMTSFYKSLFKIIRALFNITAKQILFCKYSLDITKK